MKNLFLKYDVKRLIEHAGDPQAEALEGIKTHGLKRSLGASHLILLGIGGIIGAGIFSLTGAASAYYAGPAIIYSFILGGVLCALAGLCYAEMAAMVPISGSAYAYAYATLGELIAWIIGWDLILEYAFGATTVSIAWSGYFYSLFHKTLGVEFADFMIRFMKGPWEMVTLGDGSQTSGIWNLPASFIAIFLTGVLFRGMKESAMLNNIIVVIKVTIILFFIALGWAVVDSANWIADPSQSGLFSLVPARGMVFKEGKEVLSFGWPGVLTGAGVVFFAYIGFDALSTTAQECKNPKRDLPIGILGSLFVCTALYILVALVLTGVVPYQQLGVADPVAVGVDRIVHLRGWSPAAQKTVSFLVKVGALSGLTSVILVLMLGQTRIFYAMARDGLLPYFDKIHPKYSTPYVATVVTGILVSLVAGLMPISLVGELVSIGTLLAFVLVCFSVPALRWTHPEIHRPFKTPIYWLVAPLGALSCMWVMYGLPFDTWMRLVIWLIIGFFVYFAYGVKHSKLRVQKNQ